MSSSTTVRRVKERGGAGGKITALKPHKTLTPIPDKENPGSCNKTAGKEKPRSVSVTRVSSISQKPVIRPIPMSQIDKAVGTAKDGETRVRWSTTSIPKGKNSKSNPSDFSRFLSDYRKDCLSTGSCSGSTTSVKTVERGSLGGTNLVVSNGGKGMNGFKALERDQQNRPSLASNSKENELKIVGGCKNVDSGKDNRKYPNGIGSVEQNRKMDSFLKSSAKLSVMHSSGVRVLDDCREKINFSSHSMAASDEKDADGASGSCKYNFYLDSTSKVTTEQIPNGKSKSDKYSKEPVVEVAGDGLGNVEKSRDIVCLDSRPNLPCEKASGVSKVSEISKEKVADGGKGVRVVNKYPSKLHEKLAFLEGKVKRIASDIKRTKEMLDMNNTDTSKMILSDIQDKISGIEKAMVHVVNDDGSNLDSSKTVESNIRHCKILEKAETKQVEQPKTLAKGLNHEELEARLFPHHKLIRNRTSLCTTSGSSQNHIPSLQDCFGESKPENGSLSPIDENPIALEFLASLNTNLSKVSTRDGRADVEFSEIQEMDGTATSQAQNSTKFVDQKHDLEIKLTSDENLEDFDDQENRPEDVILEETEDVCLDQIHEIGCKASTGGWFVSEGEAVLLAHDDGSCSYYDITNSEEKAEYKPPAGVSPNIWADCWLVRAPGADGCVGRYVVAASAGNTLESGFCSWDFYTKEVQAFHIEEGRTISSSRTVLGPLPNNSAYKRNALSTVLATENKQWWYKPCGPLIVSIASSQKAVKVYDIRDGEQVLKWDVQRPILGMDYSSPLQWRNRGKVVITETEHISLWDVNSLNPQALLSVSSSGRKISALHVNNTDAELGGGVRQRVSSSEAEGNDGVFCTAEGINVLDFRLPSGVGLKMSKLGVGIQSVFSRGDSIFLGCTNVKSSAKESSCSRVQQFSLRNGKLLNTYALPDHNAHFHSSAIMQVWGNSSFVMGVCSLGLFVFDALKDDGMQSIHYEKTQKVRDIIGPDDLYSPSFDYLSSRVLLISKDRPALWRHLL
ncbi:KIN14B-interacting protein At4g14310-like [Macadamia integrifolia]|uniref:KIN14B-interacting protein At4g14310-like n=1 Tax=Macadamia integrifolia TaxID=60698 RepID=UPI001C4FFC61|nr:KIN14B-interacting protein At4g14310-like [Macadamia integrifolia]